MGCQHTAQLVATVGILETEGATEVVRVDRVEAGGREEVLNADIEEGANTYPFLRGSLRTGLTAVPTGWPVPENDAVFL